MVFACTYIIILTMNSSIYYIDGGGICRVFEKLDDLRLHRDRYCYFTR